MAENLVGEVKDLSYKGLIASEDAILLVIDVQESFLEKLQKEQAETLLDNVRFLSEVAIRLDIPVMATVEEAGVNGPLHPVLRAVLGSKAPELDKVFFGLCGQDNLRSALLAQGRRTAIVVGLETDVCVLQSAVGLKELGFRAVVVLDAVAAPMPDHGHGLDRARAFGVELVHTKGLYYELARSLKGLEFLKRPPVIRKPAQSLL